MKLRDKNILVVVGQICLSLNKTYWKFCLYSMTFTPGKDYVMVILESNHSPRSRHTALYMCPQTAESSWVIREGATVPVMRPVTLKSFARHDNSHKIPTLPPRIFVSHVTMASMVTALSGTSALYLLGWTQGSLLYFSCIVLVKFIPVAAGSPMSSCLKTLTLWRMLTTLVCDVMWGDAAHILLSLPILKLELKKATILRLLSLG